MSMAPQSLTARAKVDEVCDILAGEYVIFKMCFSSIPLPFVKTISKDQMYVSKQTISSLRLMQFNLLR